MTTVDMSVLANTGTHDVTADFVGTGKVSYNLVSRHNVPWAQLPASEVGPLSIELSYASQQLQVDDTVTATVAITNNTERITNMALVTLGIPPGFAVELADFNPYLEANVLSRAKVTGKHLILYVSELAANSTQAFDYRLRATMPVRASDGGAEVSLYYQPDQNSQAPATTLVAIAP